MPYAQVVAINDIDNFNPTLPITNKSIELPVGDQAVRQVVWIKFLLIVLGNFSCASNSVPDTNVINRSIESLISFVASTESVLVLTKNETAIGRVQLFVLVQIGAGLAQLPVDIDFPIAASAIPCHGQRMTLSVQ